MSMNWLQRLQARVSGLWRPHTTRVNTPARTISGEFITPERAMRQAVVWACVRYLSSTVAQLPWCVYRPGTKGKELVPTSHTVARLLKVRPNPECGPFTFKESMVGWACTHGNAVAEIVRNARGEPMELWPIHPDNGQFERDVETGQLVYRVYGAHNDSVLLRPDDYFHLRGFGDGAVGLNVMMYAAETIGWAKATETFGAAYFGQGTTPAGILNTGKTKLSKEGKDALERQLRTKFGGAKNAHRTLVTDFDGGSFERLMADPAVAQLIETRQQQVEDICRWFGVPPHKVQHMLRSTFSNIEHQSIEVVVDSITPWCIRLEEEADWKLFNRNTQGFYTALDMKGLLRGDFKSRQEGFQIMRRNGVLNADEWREQEDMNATGKQGEMYTIEANMAPLDMLKELSSAKAKPPAAPKPQETGYDAAPSEPVALAQQQRDRLNQRGLH
jgi:HK97 family phage portal protein